MLGEGRGGYGMGAPGDTVTGNQAPRGGPCRTKPLSPCSAAQSGRPNRLHRPMAATFLTPAPSLEALLESPLLLSPGRATHPRATALVGEGPVPGRWL